MNNISDIILKANFKNNFLSQILFFLLLFFCGLILNYHNIFAQSRKPLADSLKEPVVEAMYLRCNDTNESIMVFADKSVYYARGSQAFLYVMMSDEYEIIQNLDNKAKSYVNKDNLDTCNMVAVVMRGNRYVLTNPDTPDTETKDIVMRLDLLKKDIRQKMYNSIDKFSKRADEIDSNVVQEASVKQDQIQKNLYTSLITKQWQCKGKVTLKALVNSRGQSKRAYVSNVNSESKCSPLLAMAALRAVNLSSFNAATNLNSENVSSWITVEIEFGN